MAARRKYNEIDEDRLDANLSSLEELGLRIAAADASGLAYNELKQYCRENPDYEALCQEALERYRVRFIREAEARALVGYEKPIIGGQFRDEVVATERVVSDRLLELFLKRGPHEERFTEKQELTVTGGVDLKKEFEFHKLTPTSRKALRAALETIKAENEARAQLGESSVFVDASTPGTTGDED